MECLAAAARVRTGVEAAYLGVVREVDVRDGAVGSRTEAMVREVTRASAAAARRDVAAARVTGDVGVLAGLGDRLRSGDANREHVDVAVRCLDGIPTHLVAADQVRASEIIAGALADLVDAGSDARQLRSAVQVLLARLDPEGQDRLDPDAGPRRFLDLHTDGTGMLVGGFQLDGATAAALTVALARYGAPEPDRVDAAGEVERDPRTARQRRADALHMIADMALGVSLPRRGERPRIVVHTTPEQLTAAAVDHRCLPGPRSGGPGQPAVEQHGSGQHTGDEQTADRGTSHQHTCERPFLAPVSAPVSHDGQVLRPWLLSRLSCDAVVQRIVVDDSLGPLDVRREHRLVTLAQRRALEARDGGCVICQAPPDWCDAHHIRHWAAGGPTDLAKLTAC